jgi:hypothetical protein
MPDSFLPPTWGPPPIDERDLDALLSGDMAFVPPPLRQVADALTALRAAPTPAELSGEAIAMAEFRALADFRAYGMAQAAHDDTGGHTLILPVPPADLAPRRGARHRSHRRTTRLMTRPLAALTAGAAAAVVVAAAAAAVVLPARSHHHLPTSTVTTATVPSPTVASSPGVTAKSATPEPSPPSQQPPSLTPTPQAPQPGKLCVTFFSYFEHHPEWWRSSKGKSELMALWNELSNLAGKGSPSDVVRFCLQYVGDPQGFPGNFPHQPYPAQGTPGNSGQGSQGQPGASAQPTPSPGQPASSGNPYAGNTPNPRQ